MSAVPRFADMQQRMDRANILALGYFINAVWVRHVTIQGSTGTLDTVMIPRPAARFPREWHQKEAFEAAMRTFEPIINPLLPTWLPTKVLDVTPTATHIIACAMPSPALQSHPVHARFLRKAIDIAYSIIESPRSRVVLQQLLQDMVVDWNESKKPHAYNHRSPKLASEQADVVAHFLKRLRQNFPVMKLRADSEMNRKTCIMETVRDDCTDIVPMWKFIPREEMSIVFNLKMVNQAIKIGNALAKFRSHVTPHFNVFENWTHILFRFSVDIAKALSFLFERMLAGGARPDCPLPPMSLHIETAIPIPGWK